MQRQQPTATDTVYTSFDSEDEHCDNVDTANELMYNLEESVEDLNPEPVNLHDEEASSSNSSKRSDSPIPPSFSSISGIVLL